jgi:hypothetical protein
MVFPTAVISIPEKLRKIRSNTLCYNGPSQILTLSTLTSRTVNVYGHYPSEKFAKGISADFNLCKSVILKSLHISGLFWMTRRPTDYESERKLLMPLNETHFRISYQYIISNDCQFVKKIPEDRFI